MTALGAQAWYVYGILPATAGAPSITGVLPAAPVDAVRMGGLTVLASLVPRILFDSTSPANRTSDPDWLAQRVEAHHQVAVASATTGASLPLSFGTLFSSLDLLRQWLEPRGAALRAALALVQDRSEFALSLLEDVETHTAWLDANDPAVGSVCRAAAAAPEGTAFLLARRLAKARASGRAAQIQHVAEAIGASLIGAGLHAMHDGQKSGLPAWSVLAPCRDVLTDLLSGHERRQDGLSLRLTGPWPPYAAARAALTEMTDA